MTCKSWLTVHLRSVTQQTWKNSLPWTLWAHLRHPPFLLDWWQCVLEPFLASISKAFCNIFVKIIIISKSNLQATAWSDHNIRKKIVIFSDHSDPVKQGIFAKRTHFGSIFLNFPLISSKTHCFKNWSNRSSDLIIDTKLMKHLQFAIFGESMKSSSAVRFQLRNGYFSKLKTLNHLARRPPKPQKITKNTPC